MAKVGNEAKLILRLAEERMKENVLAIRNNLKFSVNYRDGYAEAEMDYRNELERIVSELESK